MSKERVDKLVVQQGLTPSREQAQRLIMAGQIYDENNQRYDKAGEKIPTTRQLHIKGQQLPYVSRGGLKLEKAIESFHIDMTDHILLDIGASTGGFTDAALQHGAKQSYALDVGYNQLAYKLRNDDRVVVMERENFRYSTPEDFTQGQPTIASIDVSFISLRLILPPLIEILKENGSVLTLIKPQFEAGRERIGKNGVIKDPKVHQEVLYEVLKMATDLSYEIKDVTFSPITGGEGNIEYLAHLTNAKKPYNDSLNHIDVSKIVRESHQSLHS
ncbi:TlyA family RNA methyltransferase [Dolosicoccus paucivorans]|uniref:TlyA family RNA methyltransferase n=1 Tax=Dolosicoccus paucivorans TaxID=84521 RepID=A0A1G8IZ01_9LACT|nr:TlyA family RNA methyltransferase [Dolosicoccus paucivorans]PMB84655.1 TlyA family RNA methyltransferase [Dolosicoccus paucivorans]PMC59241.1 TlyA family RNA methyltransferase [Dolosicoccus paucivorans]SDI24053.1 23S rRNA (cytidine1920-2'-O)/16S rRNA (cytidine1409-2'-O)-methyltransferase [Dolosicoccus paucivorans]